MWSSRHLRTSSRNSSSGWWCWRLMIFSKWRNDETGRFTLGGMIKASYVRKETSDWMKWRSARTAWSGHDEMNEWWEPSSVALSPLRHNNNSSRWENTDTQTTSSTSFVQLLEKEPDSLLLMPLLTAAIGWFMCSLNKIMFADTNSVQQNLHNFLIIIISLCRTKKPQWKTNQSKSWHLYIFNLFDLALAGTNI